MKQKSLFILFLVFLAVFQTSVWAEMMLQARNAEIKEFPEQKGHFSSADAVNALLVPNDSGKVDRMKKMDVAMENDSEISAFQFDWLLPDGFSVVADSCNLTDRSNGHGLSISYITSNTVRFISYSGSLKTYSGNSGALVQVALKPGPEVSPGVYPLQLQNVVLSDVTGKNVVSSVQNGQFRVLPKAVYDTVFVSICEGEMVAFGNETLTTEGEYTHTFPSPDGADSVVTLYLSVNPVYQHAIEAVICQGEKYAFGTQTLSIPGNYTETFESVSGCDSTATLTLTVNPTYDQTIKAAICQGKTYQFGTKTLTNSGEYTKTFETLFGCDSTVTLTLTVHPIYEHTVEATICEGENYRFGTKTLTSAGNYAEIFETVPGCDSVVTLTLTANPTYDLTIEATICQGEDYLFGTQTLTTSGEYTETFQSVNGCDSTVTLTLIVHPFYDQTVEAAICEGETYPFGTQTLTTTGEYTENFETVIGCDSTVFLTLWVYPSWEMTVNDTISESDTLTFGDQILTEAGEFTHTFQSVNGCDSIVHLTLVKNINTSAIPYTDARFSLRQNYPNPFSVNTTIPFELETNVEEATITVYDITGREVKTWQLTNLNSGSHQVEWTGDLRTGIFIYNMHIKQNGMRSYTQTIKMILKQQKF